MGTHLGTAVGTAVGTAWGHSPALAVPSLRSRLRSHRVPPAGTGTGGHPWGESGHLEGPLGTLRDPRGVPGAGLAASVTPGDIGKGTGAQGIPGIIQRGHGPPRIGARGEVTPQEWGQRGGDTPGSDPKGICPPGIRASFPQAPPIPPGISTGCPQNLPPQGNSGRCPCQKSLEKGEKSFNHPWSEGRGEKIRKKGAKNNPQHKEKAAALQNERRGRGCSGRAGSDSRPGKPKEFRAGNGDRSPFEMFVLSVFFVLFCFSHVFCLFLLGSRGLFLPGSGGTSAARHGPARPGRRVGAAGAISVR